MCEILNSYNPLIDSENINRTYASLEIDFALDRMFKNILIINRGVNAKTIFVTNTTLFQIAAQEYGDPTLWSYLADVNGLEDPSIGEVISLIVPPKPSDNLRFGENA